MVMMLKWSTSISSCFPQTYPSRPIRWGSAHSLHRTRILQQEPSTPLQHCSAFEGACLLVSCCGGHTCRSGELRPSARRLRGSPGTTPSTCLWQDSAGRRQTPPWEKHTLHCLRRPRQICKQRSRQRMKNIQTLRSDDVSQTWAAHYPLRVSGAKLRVFMLMRLYLSGWYWWGELGSTLEKLLSAAMVSIFTQPSLFSFSPLDGCGEEIT